MVYEPAISTKLNMVVYDDMWKEDVPEGAPLPKAGDEHKASDGRFAKSSRCSPGSSGASACATCAATATPTGR